jgi:uncharacterized protein DUF6882
MTDEEFKLYLARANEELREKQACLQKEYGLGQFDRFVIDYETGRLTFFDKEVPRVEATVVPVATHIEGKNSLRWSWANTQLPQGVREEASRLKGLHDLTGFEMFANETAECDGAMAWEIAALACKFMEALGAYRVPHATLNTYLLITHIGFAPGG